MKLARSILLVIVTVAVASPVHAAGYCGFAHNFGNGAQAKVRLKGYRRTGEGVVARLVCTKWRSICNGRAGKIEFEEGVFQGTTVPRLSGTLRYGTRLACGVFCQVEGTVDDPQMLFCQFNCPSGSAAVQVSFTVGPTVCR